MDFSFHSFKILFIFLLLFSFGCGKDYEKIDNENGRQAAIDKANNYLTRGQCEEAIATMLPLYVSQYKDNQIKLMFSAGYGCKGGFSFTALIAALPAMMGGDIWSGFVASNYSKNRYDKKVENLLAAAEIIRTTSSSSTAFMNNYLDGISRPSDANLLMIFLQTSLIGVTISTDDMGAANTTTGKKTVAIAGKGSNDEKCRTALAFATVKNSMKYIDGSNIEKVRGSIDNLCTSGACPTNLDPSVCTVQEQTQGDQIIQAIDSQWQLQGS